jgi:hypothetical protein
MQHERPTLIDATIGPRGLACPQIERNLGLSLGKARRRFPPLTEAGETTERDKEFVRDAELFSNGDQRILYRE